MTVTVNQPCPFPTLYLWNRFVHSDTIVHLTVAQFIRRQAKGSCAFMNGYEIMLADRRFRLTIPTIHSGRQSVAETLIDHSGNWVSDHEKTIHQRYRKTPYFDEVFQLYRTIVGLDSPTIAEFCIASIAMVMEYLGLEKRVVDSGELVPGRNDDASTWMLDIVRAAGGTEYLCGQWAIDNYLRVVEWSGINVIGQKWQCPMYEQKTNVQFEPNLSILDLLFRHGKDSLRSLQ